MNSIVECVPNFSEGRRPEVVKQITDAIEEVSGVQLMDVHSDPDHNRTVVTVVGSPEAVEEAAFQGIAVAAQLIDMDQHQGGHPRVGATDVVPFIPVSGVTMDDCIQMARRLGQRVGDELGIPVYLYEEAATRPDRVNLADVRKGQYEGLKSEIETNPDRQPDFGPARLGSAGATVVGARPFLVAFNVYLNTDDVSVAKKIARAVRHSSGGLRFVKGLGLLVEGQAQVSMNLTDFTRTPIPRVVEMIRREAARYGVSIRHSELVGLIPQAALVDSACWYLQLDGFEPEQVLENKMAAMAKALDVTPMAFIEATAAATPTPGGGSVAALAGALAAALTSMVAGLTLGKKKYADVQPEMEALIVEAGELQARLAKAIDQDSRAFQEVMAAYRLPKETETEKAARQQAIEAATHQAASVPLSTARDALATLKLAAKVAARGNLSAITDAGSAGLMAQAAIGAASLNVQINAQSVQDQAAAQRWLAELQAIHARAAEIAAEIRQTLSTRAGLQ